MCFLFNFLLVKRKGLQNSIFSFNNKIIDGKGKKNSHQLIIKRKEFCNRWWNRQALFLALSVVSLSSHLQCTTQRKRVNPDVMFHHPFLSRSWALTGWKSCPSGLVSLFPINRLNTIRKERKNQTIVPSLLTADP